MASHQPYMHLPCSLTGDAGTDLSPSMLLKSLTMAMPRPARLYSMVSTITSGSSFPNKACSRSHGDCRLLGADLDF